jgi:hypothetical protein
MLRSEKPFSSGNSLCKSRAKRGITPAPSLLAAGERGSARQCPKQANEIGIDGQHRPGLPMANALLDVAEQGSVIGRHSKITASNNQVVYSRCR